MATDTITLPDDAIVPDKTVIELYKKMLTVYYIEERMKIFVRQGKCGFHASTRGHEKIQIGMTMLLKPGYDWFYTYYREKAVAVALGMPTRDIFLGMLGREGDPNSNGRNMPEHFSSRELNLVSMTACTGTQFLVAVGTAKAIREEGGDQVVYVSSGEGATSEGEYLEALNWAGREKLPVLFVIQNNGYAISVPQQTQTGSEVHRIAHGFGVPSYKLDGTWYETMYQSMPSIIDRIRAGKGPALIEGQVIRMDPHSSSDDQNKYRSKEELAALTERDPILQTERYLERRLILNEKQMQAMREEIKADVNQAAEEADACSPPNPDTVLTHIYSDASPVFDDKPPVYKSEEPISVVEAINRGLREEMERNPKIRMWGEDIDDPKGGVFGVTKGLSKAFPGRVTNAALAEASIVGIAGGMAIAGYKPIVEIQFADYSWPAFMQIRDEISTVRWRSNGVWSGPMVVRMAQGGYIKGGPWHSTCVEAIYSHTPGWYVVYPSTADDAKGLIKNAARCDDPVIFLEHKGLYRRLSARAPEPESDYLVPFGKSRLRREGRDLSIITWGSTVHLALELAEQMDKEGVSLEVIDLRSIVPLDIDGIVASARKTSRVLIAHEDAVFMGFGAEVAAQIAERCFDSLDAPILRVGAEDCFVPSAPNLEEAVLPQVADLSKAVEKLLSY